MVKLITAPVRQQERGLPLADTGEFPREIGEVMGDKVDDFALTLNATTDCDHAGGEDDAAIFFERLGPHDEIDDAVSSSKVMNMTPLAVPGFCRTRTRPAV